MSRNSFLFLAIAVFFAIFAVSSFAEESALTMSSVSGKVFVKTPTSGTWVEAVPGQVIRKGDSIKTAPCDAHSANQENIVNGKRVVCPVCGLARLDFADKSSITLKPNSEITFDELMIDKGAKKVGVNLTSGQLRTIIQKVDKPSDFTVKTPTAICGAMGTVFYVKADGSGTSIYVSEGIVKFTNPVTGEVYTITQGMMMTINSDGTVFGPQSVSDPDLQGWIECWDAAPVAEPFTPAGAGRNPANPVIPENTPQNPASGT